MASNETVAEIVSDMRVYAKNSKVNGGEVDVWNWLADYADRIEAAHKRERKAGAEAAQICGEIGEMIGREAAGRQPVTDCNRLGNVAKMREALSDACYANYILRGDANKEVELSRPLRNCDVGTADEQDARHSKWCRHYGIDGDMEVACASQDCSLCVLRWAQMPFEEGGVK